jgi:hypothetical protein
MRAKNAYEYDAVWIGLSLLILAVGVGLARRE